MRSFILAILFLIVSVAVGLQIAYDPGLALFQYRGWTVEMPLWFAILCFIVIIVLLFMILRFFDSIDTSFYRVKNWMRWRRRSKSYSKTNRGLLELIEARWRHAENFLLDGIDQSDAPLINYLGAAKAAHERGAFDKRDMYIRKAYDIAPQAEVVIGITQAQLQLNQGQLEQALATLNHLRTKVPKHVVVLKLLERVYIHLADWKGLLNLLPSLRRVKLFTEEQLDNLERHTYEEILNASAHRSEGLQALHEIWKSIPRRLQKHPHLVFCYTQHLAKYPGVAVEVEELINKTLKTSWEPNLVKLYGLVLTPQPQKQLAHAEKWLKLYPNQPVLLLTLGRLSMRCQLWGKARQYFEDALRLERSAETACEYGKLLEQLGDPSSAVKVYKSALV